MGAAWAGAWILPAQGPAWIPSLGLFIVLSVISWFDFDHFRIPNWLSIPLVITGLLRAVLGDADPQLSILGAVIGYGLLSGLDAYWRRYRGRSGIGLGDAKLFSAAGAWLSVYALPMVLLVASCSALASVGLSAAAQKQSVRFDQRLAFGPYLAFGFWTMWLAQGWTYNLF